MARSALPSLGTVRLLPGLEVGVVREVIWLRGGPMEKHELVFLEALPWKDRYEVVDGKYLRPLGARLPTGRLPTCSWAPISSFIQPALASPLLPGVRPAGVPLHWVPAREERKPKFLLARGSDWLAFVENAPLVRIRHLKFAQSADQQSLITGWPLPPLPGSYFYEKEGVALPAGYEICPRLSRATWQRLLRTRERELTLIHLDGSHALIPESAWVEASRSAVRLSLNAQFYV